jgi:MoxR-like ATPase
MEQNTVNASQVTSLTDRLRDIVEEQNSIFIGRAEEIKASWAATLSEEHIFLLGEPGLAKTMLLEDMLRRIEGTVGFKYLMTKDTTRSEVFGPPSITALKNDEFRYVTTGRLAEAHFAFLDEPFKASSAILNSLLTALNERQFDNGGHRTTIPLISMFCASNEIPQGDELAALYDRLLFRMYVRDLDSDSDFRQLLGKRPVLNGNPTTFSLSEFEVLRAARNAVILSDELLDKVVELRAKLRNETAIRISPRRWLKGLKGIQAYALMAGRLVAEEEDMEVFQHMLWDDLEERSKISKIVLSVINPLHELLLDLMEQAEEAYQEIKTSIDSGVSKDQLGLKASEANQKLKKLGVRLVEIRGQSGPNTHDRITQGIKKVNDYNRYVIERGLGISL